MSQTEISDLPGDVIENILLRLDPPFLIGLSRVCKDWSLHLFSRQFWIRKISRNSINLPQTVTRNGDLDWRFFFHLASHFSRYHRLSFDSNILQNGSGELETEEAVLLLGNRNEEDFDSFWFKSWTVLSSGGDGWRLLPVSETGRQFVSSYISCTKEQRICLAESGICPRVMDIYQPSIEVEELYSSQAHHGACYELHVTLLDGGGQVVGKPFIFRDNMTAREEDKLNKVTHTLTDYGAGVRYVNFYHGGFAETMEEGWHGATMTGGRVTVKYPDKIKSEF